MSSSIYYSRYWRLLVKFISLKSLLLKYILLWNQFYYNTSVIYYFLLVSLVSNNLKIMEEDISNCSPTVMFRETPCILVLSSYLFPVRTSGGKMYARLSRPIHSSLYQLLKCGWQKKQETGIIDFCSFLISV